MNDYKELIGDIGDCLIAHPSETLCKRILREAADAIEQLVKERDAAVNDIPHICQTCYGNNMEADCVDNPCWDCKGQNNPEWRWQGVQDEVSK